MQFKTDLENITDAETLNNIINKYPTKFWIFDLDYDYKLFYVNKTKMLFTLYKTDNNKVVLTKDINKDYINTVINNELKQNNRRCLALKTYLYEL